MHIAIDGGCFQQGILGGIHQVSCGFLNAAKTNHPDLEVTLVCDPGHGTVRDEALAGLIWRPGIIYADVLAPTEQVETPFATRDPHVRFFVDGRISPAELASGTATYNGPRPTASFAIISRSAAPESDPARGPRRGIRIENVTIGDADGKKATVRIKGGDRRLAAGFLDGAGHARWTDGAGFIPQAFFDGFGAEVRVDVAYSAQDQYVMAPGVGADLLLQARREQNAADREHRLARLSDDLRERGCTVYFANHFTPVTMPAMLNVAWAHDLIPVLFPQYFHPDARANFRENLRVFAAADRVYTVSDNTRRDLVANTPVTEDRAVTAGIACSKGFSPRPLPSLPPVLAPLGLQKDGYILSVATVEPRKNHMRLLLAYMALRRRIAHCPDLVLVGQMGWDFERLLTLRAESGLEHQVKILSNVPEDDLACLYSGALFSAYVSVYEGFGLPVLESMSSGCPVLTSDRSSMAEVSADAALHVNPYEVDEIADALHRLATDPALRKDLADRGLTRARHFNWDRSSKIIMDDLAVLHGNG